MGGAGRWLGLTGLVVVAVLAAAAVHTLELGGGEVSATGLGGAGAIVAADHDGRILQLDEHGATTGTVAEPDVTGGPVGGLAVADGATVWFARHDPLVGLPCDSAIFELTTSTGGVHRLAEGFAPAASPDGEHLAYVATTSTPAGECRYQAAVLDRRTGDTTRWPLDDEWGQAYGICSVAWTADGTGLVVEVCVENDAVLHAVDVDSPATIGNTTFLGPTDPQRSWTVPATGPDHDDVFAVEVGSDGLTSSGTAIVELDARFGGDALVREALDPSTWIVSMDAEPGSERLVSVEIATTADGTPRGRLVLWDRGEVRSLGHGIVAARWIR